MATLNTNVVVGETYKQDTTCSGTTYAKNYTCRTVLQVNSIDEENLKANILIRLSYKWDKVAWSGDSVAFKLYLNGELIESVSKSSGGNSSTSVFSIVCEKTLDVPYNDDGTLSITVKGAISGGTTTYSPGSGTSIINATFPEIEVSNVRICVEGQIKKGQCYVGINGIPTKAEVYIGNQDDTPVRCI